MFTQQRPITRLAAPQMATHRLARTFLVAVADRLDDRTVLGIDHFDIGSLVLLPIIGVECRAWDDILADHRKKVTEARIVGRLGDGEM